MALQTIKERTEELFRKLDQAAAEIGDIRIEDASGYERVLQLFFTRAWRTFRAIKVLADRGFGEDALVLVRTLYEDAVNLLYISADPERLSKLFLEYAHFRNFKYLQYLEENYPESLKLEDADTVRDLIREYERVKNNYTSGESWSGETVARMARRLNLDGLHETLSKIMSDIVHGNVVGVYHFLVTRDNRAIGVTGKNSLDYATQSVILAIECFRLVLNEVNRHFQLPLADTLEHTRRGLAGLSHQA